MGRAHQGKPRSMPRRLLSWLRESARCRRCGLKAKLTHGGVHARFKVDADAWSKRCRALRGPNPPVAPFACPHLAAATAQHNQPSDRAA
jgi:hypothetical protein